MRTRIASGPLLILICGLFFISCEPLVNRGNFAEGPISAEPTPKRFSQFEQRALAGGFHNLGSEELGPSDMEIRVWVDGGFETARGVILRNSGQKWTAYFLPAINDGGESSLPLDLTDRVDNWNRLENVVRQVSLVISKSKGPRNEVSFQDGQTVLLETRFGGSEVTSRSCMEPCAQNDELSTSLCTIVQEIEKDLNVNILAIPRQ